MKQVSVEIRKEIINASLMASIKNNPGLNRDYLLHRHRDIIIMSSEESYSGKARPI